MIVHFYEPPPAQKTGGLDLAIQSVRRFLERSDVVVRTNSAVDELAEGGSATVVHFHGIWQPAFLRISKYCRKRRIPYAVSPHGMLEPWAWRHKWWKKWPYFFMLERRHLAAAQRLVATSDAEADNLGRFFPGSKRAVLSLGIIEEQKPDYTVARKALGWDESEIVLLFLSRIHPKKGLRLLLAALAKLGVSMCRQARLVIVGGGDQTYVNSLKGFSERERFRLPRVDWEGEIWGETKWRYLQGADLFCLPSYSENFGIAILEALQVGTRVLTTPQTPWGDIPAWGAGRIVGPDEDAIAAALEVFLMDPEWSAEQRCLLAKETERRFAWNVVGPPYLRFYQEMLRGVGRG